MKVRPLPLDCYLRQRLRPFLCVLPGPWGMRDNFRNTLRGRARHPVTDFCVFGLGDVAFIQFALACFLHGRPTSHVVPSKPLIASRVFVQAYSRQQIPQA